MRKKSRFFGVKNCNCLTTVGRSCYSLDKGSLIFSRKIQRPLPFLRYFLWASKESMLIRNNPVPFRNTRLCYLFLQILHCVQDDLLWGNYSLINTLPVISFGTSNPIIFKIVGATSAKIPFSILASLFSVTYTQGTGFNE